MSLVYIYPVTIYETDGMYVCSIYGKSVIQRYREIDKNITFCAHFEPSSSPEIARLGGFPQEWINAVSISQLNSLRELATGIPRNHKLLDQAIKGADWVIIRAPSFVAGMAASIARKYGKPYVLEMVGCPWDAFWNYSLKGKAVAPFMWVATRRLVWDAPNVIYVTNRFLQKRYPNKGQNSISCSNVELVDIPTEIAADRRLDIHNPSRKLILGTLAAVDVRYKGHACVIRALGILKRNSNDTSFEYQMVGSGDTSRLQLLAKKNDVEEQVKFLGEYPHDEVNDWLDSLDLYIQPSRQEGLPRSLIEAMGRGLPACGSRAGGIPELLDEQFLFDQGSRASENLIPILQSFRSEQLRRDQALRNLNEAKKYRKEVLDRRRQSFLKKVASQTYDTAKKEM